jgi:hypothetical protein
MTFDALEHAVGEIRGFRWWRVTHRGWLRSPWHWRGRWVFGDNVAQCVRADRWTLSSPYPHHPEGTPSVDCACGFYALHDVPAGCSLSEPTQVWQVDATTSGTRHGLVFGVAGGHGHVLVGTTGWRAEAARVLALYLGSTSRRSRRLAFASRRYDVPVYRNLDALVAEWGPERESLLEKGSA